MSRQPASPAPDSSRQTVPDLNAKFGIPGQLEFALGKNGMIAATLRHDSGASAEVYLDGAHVTAWRTPAGENLLFLSEKSNFEPGKPIRGGIPLIFPQFGDLGPLPMHGFARTSHWEVTGSAQLDFGTVAVTFSKSPDLNTRAHWPTQDFNLEYTVTLGPKLITDLVIENRGHSPFQSTHALHTYFKIGRIGAVTIEGLQNHMFHDRLTGAVEREPQLHVTIDRETDRIYREIPERMEIYDYVENRIFTVEQRGFADAVLWNPWIEKARRMPDFGDLEYKNMVCLEAANAVDPVTTNPFERTRLIQALSYSKIV